VWFEVDLLDGTLDDREPNIDGLNLNIKKQRIEIGDLVVPDIEFCVEIKTSVDWWQSILDGRAITQPENMVVYKHRIAYEISINRNVLDPTKIKAVSTIKQKWFYKYGIPVFTVANRVELAYCINKYVDFLSDGFDENERGKHQILMPPKENRETFYDKRVRVIALADQVGLELSRRVVDKFGTIADIMNLTPVQLMQVDKIGEARANNIYDLLHK
jgi:ERCC4-type nuclease